MKTIILRAFVLPVAAFALASAGAVSTNTSNVSKAKVLITAYIHNPAVDSCKPVQVNCNTTSGPTCVSGSYPAFGGTEQSCNQQLYRN